MLAAALDRLAHRFAAGSDRDRARWHGIALAVALYLGVYGLYSQWYIEDSAIVFAYARNAAQGHGFVPWPGAERVEGFSDPTWTLALTALRVVGISPWIAAKILGAVLGAATIPLVARWARAVLPPHTDPYGPVAAAAFLAITPQFAAWNASGLENALLGFLVARGAVDLLEGAPPARTGLWWGLVAITRPEGAMYAGIAGIVGTLAAGRGGLGPALRWAVPCALAGVLPFLAWHLARYPYFAWALPNTAYAKLWDNADPQVAGWSSHGWNYLRNWALHTAQGFALPLYVLGLTGAEGRRRTVGIAAGITLVLLLIPGLGWVAEIPGWPGKEPELLGTVRVAALVLAAVVLPLVGVGREGATGRILAWAIAFAGMFFAVYSGGDWMLGFRWLALPAIPLAVLLADAVCTAAAWIRRPELRAALGVGLLGPLLGAAAWETVRYVRSADTSPFDVHDRVMYHAEVGQRLGLDLPPRMSDVDMGAHMWWSEGPILDYAGLIDVPFGHQHWQIPFEQEYHYGELRPETLHVHGSWNTKSKLREAPSFRKDYVALPPFATGSPKGHEGSFVRRDLLVGAWDGPTDRQAQFTGGKAVLRLDGFELLGTTFAPGAPLPIRTAWSRTGSAPPPVRIWMFLAREDVLVQSWELPPADGLLSVERWRIAEQVITRDLPVLGALAPGPYDLGFAVIHQRTGAPWPGTGGDGLPARMVRDEVAWAGVVQVGAPRAADAEIQAARASAVDAAANARCDDAIRAYRLVKDRIVPADPRRPDLAPIRDAIGACVAREGDLRAALRWAPTDPEVRALGVSRADAWEAEGDAALAAGKPDDAHRLWSDALAADPLRPWLRRRVEELRKVRLNLTEMGESVAPPGEEERGG